MVSVVIYILVLAASWSVYQKMGRQGWEGIIPIYSTYVLFDVVYGNGWKFLGLLIPFYNIYLLFKVYIDLAHKFNKGTGFGIGLVFLSPIFMCILGFSKDCVFEDGSVAVNNTVEDIMNGFSRSSDADELKKYKDLLDAEAITQEEYEAKKKEILG